MRLASSRSRSRSRSRTSKTSRRLSHAKRKLLLKLPIHTIKRGTCFVRGESAKNDQWYHISQWMGYYGESDRKSPYEKSRLFVSRYGKIAHFKALRNVKLLYVPYASLYMASTTDLREAARSIGHIMDHLKTSRPAVYRRHGHANIKATLLDFFLADPVDSEIGLSPNTMLSYKKHKPDGNPDYIARDVLCAIGIEGWIRTAVALGENYVPVASDEIMLCNAPALERRGYIRRDENCKPK